jgi:hypothetical protein
MNVTGFEHRSLLSFPVHRLQSAFDSALAVPENFGVISFHSKWPFVELFFVVTNSFQPTFTGLSSFFFVIDQEITLVEGLDGPLQAGRQRFGGKFEMHDSPMARFSRRRGSVQKERPHEQRSAAGYGTGNRATPVSPIGNRFGVQSP